VRPQPRALRRALNRRSGAAHRPGARRHRGRVLPGRPDRPRGRKGLASSLQAGELVAEPVEPTDWDRIVELLDQYADLDLGIVDASVVAVCERLDQPALATLDHRHFSVVRPRHRAALSLLPG